MSAYTLTAASAKPSNQAKFLGPVIAGAAITAGQPCYIDTAGLAQLADTNLAAALDVQGLAASSVAAGQPVLLNYDDPDYTHGLATVAAGDIVVLGATAGDLCPVGDLATGWFTAVIMIATSATKAVLKITKSGVAHA